MMISDRQMTKSKQTLCMCTERGLGRGQLQPAGPREDHAAAEVERQPEHSVRAAPGVDVQLLLSRKDVSKRSKSDVSTRSRKGVAKRSERERGWGQHDHDVVEDVEAVGT